MSLIKAIKMQSPETIPVAVGMLPAMWLKYGEELQRIVDEYPQFFNGRKVETPFYSIEFENSISPLSFLRKELRLRLQQRELQQLR